MKLMDFILCFSRIHAVLVLSVAPIFFVLPYEDIFVRLHLNIAHLQFVRAVELPEWFTPNSIPIIRGDGGQNAISQNALHQALTHLKAVVKTCKATTTVRAYQLSGQIEILLQNWDAARLAYEDLHRLAPDITLRSWEKVFLLLADPNRRYDLSFAVEAKDLLESADIAFRYQQFAIASKYYELAALNDQYQKTHQIDYEGALSNAIPYLLFQYLLSSALSDSKDIDYLISVMRQRESKFEVMKLSAQLAPLSIDGWKFFWMFNGSPVDTNAEVGYLWSPHLATVLVNVSDDGVYTLTPHLFAVETNSVQANLFIDGELLYQFEAYADKNLVLQPMTSRAHLTKGFHMVTLQILPDLVTNKPQTAALISLLIDRLG